MSTIVMLPIGLWSNAPALLDTQYWGKALVIAILATAIPYALDLMALKRLSKLSYGTLTSLAPALAALAGLVILHEQISLLQWVALLCIMLASIGVTLRGEKSQTQ
jgi:inner membrane transporter RhtA